MTRIILRALNSPAFIFMVTLGVALQTSIFASYPLMYLQPDVILIAIVWCALKRGFLEGGILTLIFANIAEIHSGSPQGFFMVCYMSIYLLVRAVSRFVVIPSLAGLVALTLGGSVFFKLELLGILHLMDLSGNQWKHTLVLLFPGAVMTGAFSIWIFRWLDRFDTVTFKSARARRILEDELQLEGEGL